MQSKLPAFFNTPKFSRALAALLLAIGALIFIVWKFPTLNTPLTDLQEQIGTLCPLTAISFSFLSLSLIFATVSLKFSVVLYQGLALSLMGFSIYSLAARSLGAASTCGLHTFSILSPFSALIFFALSVGVLCLRPRVGVMKVFCNRQNSGGIARKMLAVALGVPLLIEGLRAWVFPGSETTHPFAAALTLLLYTSLFLAFIFFHARALAHNEVQQSRGEERFATALDAAHVGTWELDLKAQLKKIDIRLARILGLPALNQAETLKSFYARVIEEDRLRVIEALDAAVKDRVPYEQEMRILRSDGQIRWLRDRGRFMITASGQEVFSGATGDITHIKLAESENAQLLSREQEAVRARDEFLAIASHELKTPLTSLKLQTQMHRRNLERGDPHAFSPDKMKRMVESSDKQIDRLSRLIDEMLDINRISAGKLSMQIELFDFSTVFLEVVERMAPQFEAAGSELVVDCDSEVMVQWDRFRIEQVLSLLLHNALKYGAAKPVFLSLHKSEDLAVIEVRDQGIGIAPEDQERIFQRFERVAPAQESSGLGLGLYIVKQILERHRGRVWIESVLGQGAKFVVEIPLKLFRGVT